MLTFIFMNFVVISCAFFITYKIFKIEDFIDSLIVLFIFYFSQIIITQTLLGIAGILYLGDLLLINALILLILWSTLHNKEYFFKFSGSKEILKGLLNNKVILFAILVISVFGLVKIFINLANPPFGWDDLNYHFTFPVEWLKHGNLDNPITISDDPSPSYYPINGSLFFLWLIFPLKSVFFADIGQVPFFILAFLAVYNISRKINLDRDLSFYSASLFVLIPNFF